MYEPPVGKCFHGCAVWRFSNLANDIETFLDRWASIFEKRFVLFSITQDMTYDFSLTEFEYLCRKKVVNGLVLTWEPIVNWNLKDIDTISKISMEEFDPYIKKCAHTAKKFPYPLYVRLGQEMNGHWYGWGFDDQVFVNAWRRIVDLFRSEGADNVAWTWCPDKGPHPEHPEWAYPGRKPFENYWPGDDYVDWCGVDIFSNSWYEYWRKDRRLTFDSWLKAHCSWARRHNKPFQLSEVGILPEIKWSKPEITIPDDAQVEFLGQCFDALEKDFAEIKALMLYLGPTEMAPPEEIWTPKIVDYYKSRIANERYQERG